MLLRDPPASLRYDWQPGVTLKPANICTYTHSHKQTHIYCMETHKEMLDCKNTQNMNTCTDKNLRVCKRAHTHTNSVIKIPMSSPAVIFFWADFHSEQSSHVSKKRFDHSGILRWQGEQHIYISFTEYTARWACPPHCSCLRVCVCVLVHACFSFSILCLLSCTILCAYACISAPALKPNKLIHICLAYGKVKVPFTAGLVE